MGALDGIRVVDLSRVLAGPLCTQMLADHGADVIKVEPPMGDETRLLGPPFDDAGDAAYFAAVNRGKRALSVDLGKPEGRAVLEKLLDGADVLVENFLPGTMEKWGLGYATLAQRHPRLVYCAISGFGADGPLGGLPGYDAVLQAMCGLMSVNGSEESGTMRLGIPIVDHLTGYVAMTGILMALYARERSGKGQRVEATLFDAGLSLLVPHAGELVLFGPRAGPARQRAPEHQSVRQVPCGRRRDLPRRRQRRPVPETLRPHRQAGPRGGHALQDQCEPAREPRAAAGRARDKRLPRTRWNRFAGTSCARAFPPDPCTPFRRLSRRRMPRIAAWSSRTAAIAVSARRSRFRKRARAPRASRRVSASMPTRSLPRPATQRDQIAELRRKDIVRERPLQH